MHRDSKEAAVDHYHRKHQTKTRQENPRKIRLIFQLLFFCRHPPRSHPHRAISEGHCLNCLSPYCPNLTEMGACSFHPGFLSKPPRPTGIYTARTLWETLEYKVDLLSANVLLGIYAKQITVKYLTHMYLHSCSEGREEERVQVDLLWEEDSPTSCHIRTTHTHRVSILYRCCE